MFFTHNQLGNKRILFKAGIVQLSLNRGDSEDSVRRRSAMSSKASLQRSYTADRTFPIIIAPSTEKTGVSIISRLAEELYRGDVEVDEARERSAQV